MTTRRRTRYYDRYFYFVPAAGETPETFNEKFGLGMALTVAYAPAPPARRSLRGAL